MTAATYLNGGINSPGTNALDPSNPDVEVMLDIEVCGSVAPGAKIVVYFGPDASDQGFLSVMNAILGDTINKPNIVSISWGGPEDSATAQFRDAFDELLQTAAQLGVTVCVASGDSGSADFASAYLGGASPDDVRASPVHADLSGLTRSWRSDWRGWFGASCK